MASTKPSDDGIIPRTSRPQSNYLTVGMCG
jgi:hypothetical protein